MRILVLGQVEIRSDESDGAAITLGGAKPKALLAALLMQPRQVVPTERLIGLLWDESPPASAAALVHNYVSVVRRAVTAAGRQGSVTTKAPGYLLDVDPTDSDLESFENHLYAARHAERQHDHDSATGLFEQALRLWRGPAFGGVEAGFARSRSASLADERLAAEEGLARCMLQQGRAGEVAAHLRRLVNAHPLREQSRVLLMRALHESGRQGDALAVYRNGREQLMAQRGVEPGAELRELHSAILNGSLRTPGPRRRVATRSSAPHAVPRNLPPDVSDFTGRAEQLHTIMALSEAGAAAAPAVVVSGAAGTGKSALAVHAAHRLRVRYPDGQLFADLRGSCRDLGAHEVLSRFLGELGVEAADMPADFAERVALFRGRVGSKRLLVVLDNARDEEQVRYLLPQAPGCLVIVTSRSRLPGLFGAVRVELDLLSTEASLRMLGRVVGLSRVESEPMAAATIAELCGGIPLAVRAAGAKLLARPHWPLRALATRLTDERRRFDEPADGDLAVRCGLLLTYAELDDVHRHAFHLLALLDLPDFGSWLAAPLLEVGVDEAEDVVERLVVLRLVEVAGIDAIGRVRYRFHDMVQLFGTEQANREEPADAVAAAVCRTLAAWMCLVEAGANKLPRVTLGLRPVLRAGVELDARLVAETQQDPSGWFKSETGAVVRTVERAHELGIDEMTTMLIAALLSSPFAARNEFDGWQRTHEVALAAARDTGDTRAEATVLTGLGQLYYEKDEYPDALAHFTQAAEGAAKVDDDTTLAIALVGVGTVHRDLANFQLAREHLARAIQIGERAGDLIVVAAADYGLASIWRDLGDIPSAASRFTRCAEAYRALGDARGAGLALRGLGLCHRAVDEVDLAVSLSEEAESVLRAAGDQLGATYAAQSLAKARIRQGRVAGVAESLADCLTLCTGQGDRFGVALMTRTLGELALAEGETQAAAGLLVDALGKWTELRLPLWQARTLRDLAAAEVDTDPALADAHWARAVALFAEAGTREVAELAELTAGMWSMRVRNCTSVAERR
ncbi:AfsR/SARP family transcriptional regulator [Actinokineospora globicatena]|uniref:AfsR/SARP family transcriptional regulator n=1 Tax=Actinokineospora globicatena TaxID=103729 RepID=UPI0020A56E40|nr:AfsR/SARP family transcriptional regulator [Actinokineospora globicatena]MCP2301101.1 DNA-binding transcriptional activator of the SARP family [Actinokineospora globicatena]GLW77263.1 SARP family transcriptional regulator [Actinokineospora globicatena]GLW84097.1 SARP family transcriptional regulator [Actinokineospora globicatena]